MRPLHQPLIVLAVAITLLAQGCGMSSHPAAQATLGKPTGSAEMERVLDQPGPVQLESINSADWAVPLAGLVNLKSPAAIQAGLKDREEAIQVYAHVLKHPQRGSFLVDTGVSKKLLDDPAKAGLSWLLRQGMPIDKMKIQKSTADILDALPGKLSGVFFTHLHIDHISGMPDIPNDVPLYVGKTESTEKNLINLFVHGSTNQLLQGKQHLQEWGFQADPAQHFEGVVDIFEDGSVFAISVPGHTSGSTAYLVRTPQGPVLLTGDTCHTRWGWEHTVEPGDFTQDNARNLKNLISLKKLVERHPKIDVRLGHQR
ncbi:MBL fold metallo-hydrolase [Rhodoferax sp.]|uniref:MBL fold metallo-hydrolase n=1 Tax=Rhodoferax sp. TaxID=50421 RepID=UPI002771857F|nr:MBL fold metallo-hydrolase [Rhodoferax sp.]